MALKYGPIGFWLGVLIHLEGLLYADVLDCCVGGRDDGNTAVGRELELRSLLRVSAQTLDNGG